MAQHSTIQAHRAETNRPIEAHTPQSMAGLQSAFGLPELGATTMTFDRNAEIYGESEPSDYVYKVVSGAVRTYRVLSDGRRQVGAFYLPGDVFGLELAPEHTDSAEAITNSQILFVRRSTLLAASQRNGDVTRQLLTVTAQELRRAENHSLLLIKSAQERLVAFLLEMSQRLSAKAEIELPMSRQDIADYLGLTIETVSRTLTQLEDDAAITLVASRRIALRNRSVLNELNA